MFLDNILNKYNIYYGTLIIPLSQGAFMKTQVGKVFLPSDPRFMVDKDISEVVAIEAAVFPSAPWNEKVVKKYLNRGSVVVHNGKVVGYIFFDPNKRIILRMAVAQSFRKMGFGRALVSDQIRKLCTAPRNLPISVEIHERNLSAQLFFRKMEFRYVEMYPFSPDTDDKIYCFKYFPNLLLGNVAVSVE
jgi:GNAT superfamily N-acetyltransferase